MVTLIIFSEEYKNTMLLIM